MPKIKKYSPDKGELSLISFYDSLGQIDNGPNGLYYDLIQNLDKLEQSRNAQGKLVHRLGVWLKTIDNPKNKWIYGDSRYCQKTLKILEQGTYDSICKKLLLIAKSDNSKLWKLYRNWLLKLAQSDSEYFCSQFRHDLEKIDPRLHSLIKDNDTVNFQRKNWLRAYLSRANYHPFPNIKLDKEAKKFADGLVTISSLTIRKNSPSALFADFCYPDSENFDAALFEEAFAKLQYKVDKNNPDNSVKELIVRILSHGDFIDSPVKKDEVWCTEPPTHTSLFYWFDRYTNKESKFYDEKFTNNLKQKFPQQFSIESLRYKGHRRYDKRKDKFIEKLTKDPDITYNEVKGFIRNQTGIVDPVFFEICEKIRKENKKPEPQLVVVTPKGKFSSRQEAREKLGLSVWQLGDKIRNKKLSDWYETYE